MRQRECLAFRLGQSRTTSQPNFFQFGRSGVAPSYQCVRWKSFCAQTNRRQRELTASAMEARLKNAKTPGGNSRRFANFHPLLFHHGGQTKNAPTAPYNKTQS